MTIACNPGTHMHRLLFCLLRHSASFPEAPLTRCLALQSHWKSELHKYPTQLKGTQSKLPSALHLLRRLQKSLRPAWATRCRLESSLAGETETTYLVRQPGPDFVLAKAGLQLLPVCCGLSSTMLYLQALHRKSCFGYKQSMVWAMVADVFAVQGGLISGVLKDGRDGGQLTAIAQRLH